MINIIIILINLFLILLFSQTENFYTEIRVNSSLWEKLKDENVFALKNSSTPTVSPITVSPITVSPTTPPPTTPPPTTPPPTTAPPTTAPPTTPPPTTAPPTTPPVKTTTPPVKTTTTPPSKPPTAPPTTPPTTPPPTNNNPRCFLTSCDKKINNNKNNISWLLTYCNKAGYDQFRVKGNEGYTVLQYPGAVSGNKSKLKKAWNFACVNGTYPNKKDGCGNDQKRAICFNTSIN